LLKKLPQAENMDTFRDGLTLLLRNSPARKQVPLLKNLESQKLVLGGDYVLWRLSQFLPNQANRYYRKLVEQYPDSDYAPESSWSLMWPDIKSGQYQSYLAKATEHVNRYPRARSASTALFWKGKVQEKLGQKQAAIQTYQTVLNQYPTPHFAYYAFRSYGRLQALTNGKDPGWTTQSALIDYPPEYKLKSLQVVPDLQKMNGVFRQQIEELQEIGAPKDIMLLADIAQGGLSEPLKSWKLALSGKRDESIRVIREYLAEQAEQDASYAHISPAVLSDQLRLLYPVYFTKEIAAEVKAHPLDPYIVQSLMREESYFNELAISSSRAMGLMQLLPSTAREVAGWNGNHRFQSTDLFIPEVNVRLGTHYLYHLHQLFQGSSMPAVGGYNGGPNAMKRWIAASNGLFVQDPDMFVESIPYAESKNYIKKVFGSYWNYQKLYQPERYPKVSL
jgi:soluble lytic murein transglycosylase-like protein